jgi:predicted peroxiredoxin
MAESQKVVVNLATGLDDAERVTVAFLVAGAALEKGKQVAMFLTKEASALACLATRRRLPATAVHPFRSSSRSTQKAAASFSSVRSASTRASLTKARSSQTPALPERHRSGTGSTRARPCSATREEAGWQLTWTSMSPY